MEVVHQVSSKLDVVLNLDSMSLARDSKSVAEIWMWNYLNVA